MEPFFSQETEILYAIYEISAWIGGRAPHDQYSMSSFFLVPCTGRVGRQVGRYAQYGINGITREKVLH